LKLSKENNLALIKIAETYTNGVGGGGGLNPTTATTSDDKTLGTTAREVLRICKTQLSS